jgi:hypothetical protein
MNWVSDRLSAFVMSVILCLTRRRHSGGELVAPKKEHGLRASRTECCCINRLTVGGDRATPDSREQLRPNERPGTPLSLA